MRLRGIAQQVCAVVYGAFGDGGKVHMRGDVLQSGQKERIIMGIVAVVAHQGARIALRMIVLVCAKAVVDEQQGTFAQALAQAADQAASGE